MGQPHELLVTSPQVSKLLESTMEEELGCSVRPGDRRPPETGLEIYPRGNQDSCIY